MDLGDVLDPHTVCGLLKLHFRELRVSMIPRGPPLAELIHNVKERNVSHVLLRCDVIVTHFCFQSCTCACVIMLFRCSLQLFNSTYITETVRSVYTCQLWSACLFTDYW